jgi:vancomycin resistance protein YoaR
MKSYKLIIGGFVFFLLFGINCRSVFADNSTTTATSTLLNIRGAADLPTTTLPSALSGPGFTFTFGQQNFTVSQTQVSAWENGQTVTGPKIMSAPLENFTDSLLSFVGQPVPAQNLGQYYNYSLGQIYNYIQTLASTTLDTNMANASLQIQNGRATNFIASQTGQEVDVYKSALAALNALSLGKATSELSVYQEQPDTSLQQTNNLGINELIGEGVSKFNGSPNNRRVNIAVGIEKFKGLIIPQGATFSFDDNLGPVTADAGFLPELVIDDGNTLPELGGGLCQVSTTVFRAAMAAGVPITDRRNHAYAVEYYSPQGTDATIYPGSADLKFVNDTPGAILVWPYEKDPNTLVFDFYGTNDGRKVTLEKPVVYDRQSDGSMKATWTRLVTPTNGQTRTDVFNSNYQSPALFHKTETFVSATGVQTPNSTPTKTQ